MTCFGGDEVQRTEEWEDGEARGEFEEVVYCSLKEGAWRRRRAQRGVPCE